MGALDDYLAEYEGREQAPEPAAKPEKAKKYTSFSELVGNPAQAPTPTESKPSQVKPDVQKKIDAAVAKEGYPPGHEPFSWGGAARAIGNQFVNEAKAIPAAFNDAFSMGAIPAIQEAQGGSLPPGTYQKTMEAGPVGTAIGQAAGMVASGGAGLAKPLAQGGQMLASGLRKAGAFAAPATERAVASGIASAGYGAADAAVRGGTPEQVFDAGMTGGAIGAGIPLAAKGVSSTYEGGKNLAGKIAGKSIAAAENRSIENVIDKAPRGKVEKAEELLKGRMEIDSTLDPETAGKEAILQTARKHDLGKDLLKQSIPKFADAVETKKAAAGQEIGRYIEKASQLTPGVRLDALVDSFEKIRAQHAAGSGEYKALTQKIAQLQADYAETNVVGGVPRVPMWEVQDMATKAAKQGWAGVGIAFNDPTAAKKLGRQTAYALRQPLYDEINRVALRNPSSVGTPEGFAKARARYADLSSLSDIAEAARPKVDSGKEGLLSKMEVVEHLKRAAESGGLATLSHFTNMPHWVTTLAAAAPYIKPAASAGNAEVAKLINAARSGFPANMYNAAAESLRVSPEIAARVWQQFSPAVIGSATSQEALSQPSQENAP